MISACWGVFIWREFATAPSQVKQYLTWMFVLFIAGLSLVAVAPNILKKCVERLRDLNVTGKPIVVVGSINIDLVAKAERIPVSGETVAGLEFQIHPGGKGANQAVASPARLSCPPHRSPRHRSFCIPVEKTTPRRRSRHRRRRHQR